MVAVTIHVVYLHFGRNHYNTLMIMGVDLRRWISMPYLIRSSQSPGNTNVVLAPVEDD